MLAFNKHTLNITLIIKKVKVTMYVYIYINTSKYNMGPICCVLLQKFLFNCPAENYTFLFKVFLLV